MSRHRRLLLNRTEGADESRGSSETLVAEVDDPVVLSKSVKRPRSPMRRL